MKNLNELTKFETGKRAIELVAAKLVKIGLTVDFPTGNKNLIIARFGKENQVIKIRVKSRRSGDWQIPITEGRSPEEKIDENEFFVFVDFKDHSDEPVFFVMTGSWLRRNIYIEHHQYLQLHGGIRPISPKSTHHSVKLERVVRWKENWKILENWLKK